MDHQKILILGFLLTMQYVNEAHSCSSSKKDKVDAKNENDNMKNNNTHRWPTTIVYKFPPGSLNEPQPGDKSLSRSVLGTNSKNKASNCGPDGCAYQVSFNQRTGNIEIEADFSQTSESKTNQGEIQRSVASSDVNIPDSSAAIPINSPIPAFRTALEFPGTKNGVIQNNPMAESETNQDEIQRFPFTSVPIHSGFLALRTPLRKFPGTKNGAIQKNPMPESETNQAPIQSSIPALQTALRFSGLKNGIIQTNPKEYGTIPEKETNQARMHQHEFMDNIPPSYHQDHILPLYDQDHISYKLGRPGAIRPAHFDYNHGIIESNPMAFNGLAS